MSGVAFLGEVGLLSCRICGIRGTVVPLVSGQCYFVFFLVKG
jgi:hypothetical protein